ncbi:MAG: hypothetical protein IJY12_04350 [Clostridia bacterium]|nr:hypothetical protein [Clostridia bacterium]
MNFIASENQSSNAASAVYLLKKYAKNKDGAACTAVTFSEDRTCAGDDYRIAVGSESILVFANTAVGFNAATGYLLRHQETEIESKTVHFAADFRAVYFANHFYNYYHAAPTEELCDYLESLALWGQSALCLWFDMHHFESLCDPRAEQMLQKMTRLFEKARSLGMKTSLTRLPNEYYVGANPALLAENTVTQGRYREKLCGFYYTELCPSKKEGEALLLSSFDALMTRFASVGLDYIMLWPYDQGGCTCEACYPWGSNGFYRLAKKQAAIAKKHFPHIEIILSCWRFNHFTDGEWEGILPLIKKDGAWIDRLMVDIDAPLPDSLPSVGKPIVSFPEISMYHATPWGGFGANPFPQALYAQFQKTKSFCRGGALYSEGIFEDINKAVSLELMRDPSIDPKQAVLEYCSYHFGADHAEALADIILRSEETLKRATYLANGKRCDYPSGKPEALHTFVIKHQERVEELERDLLAIDQKLPSAVRENWRYQQIYARLIGDAALMRNSGVPSEETDEIFSRLIPIYHAENAYYFVAPLTRRSVMENLGNGV